MGPIQSFLFEMKYHISTGDKRSDRYNLIKDYLQPQIGSGLKFTPSPSKSSICIFLPCDFAKLTKKVGGNDHPQLNDHIIAIAENFVQYQCITPSEH